MSQNSPHSQKNGLISPDRYRKEIDRLLATYAEASSRVGKERQALKSAKSRLSDTKEAVVLIQEVAASVQAQAHARISLVVTRCLSAIFDDPYTFTITFERKRNRTEAKITFCRAELEIEPEDGVGGGVLDVAAFGLRLAALTLSRPQKRRLLVLDEPFKFLSRKKGYRGRVRDLIESLAEEMDVQFIIITHMDELRVGSVIDLTG